MNNINLTKSAVAFNPADHSYKLGERKLSGVTPIVKWVYPETYGDIPEEVLAKAAERGTAVHLDCQMADAGFAPSSREAEAYIRLKEERGLTTLANEWLVDDGQDIASSIDVVFDNYAIADIKATSKIHYDNVTLQLSIYAWLLEEANPGLAVPDTYVIWLPREQYGVPAMTRLERIPSDIVAQVVRMYLDGDTNEESRKMLGAYVPNATPEDMDLEQEYCRLDAESKAAKARMDEIKAILLERMQESGDKKYEWPMMTVSYVAGKESAKLDTTRLKKEHADIYEEFCKTEKSKPYVQIKIKQ